MTDHPEDLTNDQRELVRWWTEQAGGTYCALVQPTCDMCGEIVGLQMLPGLGPIAVRPEDHRDGRIVTVDSIAEMHATTLRLRDRHLSERHATPSPN